MSIMNNMMYDAYTNNYSIGAFNCYSYETIKSVISSAVELNQPAVIAFGAKYLINMSLEDVRGIVDTLTSDINVDIALHLDHCSDINLVYKAIASGFDSVMYDGSHLSFEENLNNTKRVVEVAHSCGVCVEAELGSIETGTNSHEGKLGEKTKYTDPALAKKFVEETNVDFLAVSIGTVHGNYKGKPEIRIDILKELNEKLSIPLVLHGGSGTPEDELRSCIENGISKININTEISNNVIKNTKKLLENEEPHLSVLNLKQQDYMESVIKKYIKLFK